MYCVYLCLLWWVFQFLWNYFCDDWILWGGVWLYPRMKSSIDIFCCGNTRQRNVVLGQNWSKSKLNTVKKQSKKIWRGQILYGLAWKSWMLCIFISFAWINVFFCKYPNNLIKWFAFGSEAVTESETVKPLSTFFKPFQKSPAGVGYYIASN